MAYQPQDADALVAVLSGQLAQDAYRGVVRVGGISLSDMDLRLARRTVLVEPHITDLFSGSLASNVTAGAVMPLLSTSRVLWWRRQRRMSSMHIRTVSTSK